LFLAVRKGQALLRKESGRKDGRDKKRALEFGDFIVGGFRLPFEKRLGMNFQQAQVCFFISPLKLSIILSGFPYLSNDFLNVK
jgi:hypothetical protein